MTKLAVVVLAAGKGTRMKSDLSKVLHRVAGRPMIEFPVGHARALGAERVVCVLGHQADAVEKTLKARYPEGIRVAMQHEQLGTGHAVAQALPALEDFISNWPKGQVLILSGDVPLLTQGLLQRLVEAGRDRALAMVTMRLANPTGYGRIVRDAGGRVQRIVEHKDATEAERKIDEVNAGLYVVRADFLGPALQNLSSNNAQGELYLTDIVSQAAAREAVATVDADPVEVMGINDRAELSTADRVMRTRIAEGLMKSGVTMWAPETSFVDAGVIVGHDTEIGPNVQLRGKTTIGAGCQIDAGSILVDATLADGVHVKAYCVVTESSLGEGTHIGPFAHLRPGSELGAEVKIGNFVETKKARFGRGAKASHLSYLGDAEIGADVNIGCGTITCNYDGYNKHQTVIEDGAFIGSDTQLVAPVKVGAGAVIGSGTTVTVDVSPGALAVSRVKQTEVPGWADKKRKRELARKAEKAAAKAAGTSAAQSTGESTTESTAKPRAEGA